MIEIQLKNDVNSNFGKEHYSELYVGKDNRLYYKNTNTVFIDADTTFSPAIK